MKIVSGLLVLITIGAFANGNIGAALLFGLLAYVVFRGSFAVQKPTYKYEGSTHHFRRVK